MNNGFETAYSQLNAAQKQAVDQVEGPVLVVAGPGTGKTQLLSMRVANILRQTDADPGSILCLTFTNKAALNMRERLIDLTGGEAKGVLVKTFHSFAAELMNMYPDHFWNGARLSTAPDTTQIEIIQDILSKLPLSSPLALKFAGNFTAGRDVKNSLKYVKEAGLTPEKLKALVTANLAYIDSIEDQLVDILSSPLSHKSLATVQAKVGQLPNQGLDVSLQPLQDLGQVIKDSLDFAISQDQDTGKTKNTGKWKQRWIQSVEGKKGMHKERERNTWWLHLSDVYKSYRQELHNRGYYDYSDMIVEVITQLQNNPNLRADAQERFLYVLIDEFQDTNAAQLQLAHLIADHPLAGGNPNLMAVGDDDQSIYKFNGAELNNMLSFQKSYPAAKLIVLTENYRSSQAVLDTSAKIINQVTDRLVTRMPNVVKDLVAKNQPKNPGVLTHYSYPTEEHQLQGVADSIAEHYSSENIAVLARDHASLQKLASMLTSLNIPVSYERQNNILDNPAVKQIHTINSLLVAIANGNVTMVNIYLSQMLRAPMWQLSPELLWQIASTNQRNKSWLDYMLKSNNDKLQSIAKWLVWLAQEATQEPLCVTLEYVMGLRAGEHLTSPFKEYFARKAQKGNIDTDYVQALSSVRLLTSLANDYARSSNASLSEFVQFIQLSIDAEEIIADESVFVTGDNAVQLLTVHKAKGLEFDTVYIINAIDSSWRPGTGGRKCPANLPLQPAGDDIDDYARLMYVAATRAKHSIIATSYQQDTQSKPVMASPLIHDILELSNVQSTIDPVIVLEQSLTWPHLNSTDEKRILASQLENLHLSVSGLLDFLDVSRGGPEYFFERHILRLPEATSANMAFGTAVHAALELAQIMVNGSGVVLPKVLDHYQEKLEGQFLPKHEYQKFLEHGKELITKLLKSDTFWLGKGDIPEQSLSDVLISDDKVQANLKGVIDRVNISGDQLTIIDYKTGKPLGSFVTRDQNKAIKAWRHRSQLVFYALLVRSSNRFNPKNIAGQMWYVEASSAKELIREYIPGTEELDRMEKLILKVWPKIKDLNLPDISNYSADYSGIQAFEQDLLDNKI